VGPRAGGTGADNLAPTGIPSPDRPARSGLLYRLRYPGTHTHTHTHTYIYIHIKSLQCIVVVACPHPFTTAITQIAQGHTPVVGFDCGRMGPISKA